MSATEVFDMMMEAAPLADKLRDTVKDEPLQKWFTAMLMAMLGVEVGGKPMSAETIISAARVIAKIRDEASSPGRSNSDPTKSMLPLDGGTLDKIWQKGQ